MNIHSTEAVTSVTVAVFPPYSFFRAGLLETLLCAEGVLSYPMCSVLQTSSAATLHLKWIIMPHCLSFVLFFVTQRRSCTTPGGKKGLGKRLCSRWTRLPIYFTSITLVPWVGTAELMPRYPRCPSSTCGMA